MIYFDNAATALPHPALASRLLSLLTEYPANPSAAHSLGIKARHELERVRQQVADMARVKPGEVIFTSGGTEANNMLLQGVLQPGDHLITSPIEHASIDQLLPHLEGVSVTKLDDLTSQSVLDAIRPQTKLVSLMHVNNETGQVFDFPGLHKELKRRRIYYHRDAVQSFGKLSLDGEYDFLSFSAHKIGGLKGTGGLIARQPLKPLLWGGDQEKGLRPGTENLPGILALGLVLDEEAPRISQRYAEVAGLNQRMRQLLAKDCHILSPEDASPYILSLSVPGVPSEVLLNAMSGRQMYFSAGSACSARSKHHSHVIAWLTQDEAIRAGALRLSFSWQNDLSQVEEFARQLIDTIDYIRKVIG